jgi:hypothetical protein
MADDTDTQHNEHNVLVVAIFKNEAHILVEWLNHYRAQGVDHVVLIDNGSTDDYMYELRPFLEARYVSLFIDDSKHVQADLYNKYSQSFWTRFAWVVVVDLDEFMFATEGPLAWWLGTKVSPEVAVVDVRWTMFGSSGHVQQPESVLRGFRYRALDSNSKSCWQFSKYAVRTRALRRLGIHEPKPTQALTPHQVLRVACVHPGNPQPPVRIHHYAVQSWQFFRAIKMTRGDAHAATQNGVRDSAYFARYDANEVEDGALANCALGNAVHAPLFPHPVTLVVVVAYFAEQLQPLFTAMEAMLPHGPATRVFFYNKGPSKVTFPAAFVAAFPSASMHTLPNVGRCDHTFLHHLKQHYETYLLRPSGHVLFLPASKHEHLREVLAGPLNAVSATKHAHHPDYVPWSVLGQFKLDNYQGIDKANNSKLRETGKGADAYTTASIRPYGRWFHRYFGYTPDPSTEVRVVTMGIFRFPARFATRNSKALIGKLLDSVAVSSNCEEGHYMERAWHSLLTKEAAEDDPDTAAPNAPNRRMSRTAVYITVAVAIAVAAIAAGLIYFGLRKAAQRKPRPVKV